MEVLARATGKEKVIKYIQIGKVELFLFADKMILKIKNSKHPQNTARANKLIQQSWRIKKSTNISWSFGNFENTLKMNNPKRKLKNF